MRRWRKTVLWIGCTLCVLIAVAFVVSARWQVALQFPSSRGPAMFLTAGSVLIANEMLTVPVSAVPHSLGLSRWNSWLFGQLGKRRWPDRPIRTVTYVEFPLYTPFLAVLLPTLAVWRFVPKFPPGHCRRCGYNLTGLTEARCPECGTGSEQGG